MKNTQRLKDLFYHWKRNPNEFFAFMAGPIFTIMAIYFASLVSKITLAPLTLVLVAVCFTGGFIPGLVTAALISAYVLVRPDLDFSPLRIFIVLSTFYSTVILVGFLKWQASLSERVRKKADLVDSINGNLELLHDTLRSTDQLVEGWLVLDRDARLRRVKEIRGNLADLTTLVMGWQALYKQKEELRKDIEE